MGSSIQSAIVFRSCVRSWGCVYGKPTLLAALNFGRNELSRGKGCHRSSFYLSPKGPCATNEICGCNGLGTVRYYSAAKPKPTKEKSLQEARDSSGGAVTLSTAEKVKENVKTVSYGGVIVVGVVIGGAMLYYVLNELFSSESPNNIYSHTFKLCKLSTEVQDTLGSPIKCYGEESRRGWRRHVACQQFLAGETKFIRMRFYIEGTFRKGTVNVEKKTNDKGKYEYTYVIVDVDGYPPRRIDVPF